jgi:hypothetical protein
MCVSLLEAGLLRARASPFVFSPAIAGMTAHGTFLIRRRLGKCTVDFYSRKLPLDRAKGQDVVSKPK